MEGERQGLDLYELGAGAHPDSIRTTKISGKSSQADECVHWRGWRPTNGHRTAFRDAAVQRYRNACFLVRVNSIGTKHAKVISNLNSR
jgi:hypothetical protein